MTGLSGGWQRRWATGTDSVAGARYVFGMKLTGSVMREVLNMAPPEEGEPSGKTGAANPTGEVNSTGLVRS